KEQRKRATILLLYRAGVLWSALFLVIAFGPSTITQISDVDHSAVDPNLADKVEIKRVIQASEDHKFFYVYTDPTNYDKHELKKFWLAEKAGGVAISVIKVRAQTMRREGWRYGPGIRNFMFEFIDVRVMG